MPHLLAGLLRSLLPGPQDGFGALRQAQRPSLSREMAVAAMRQEEPRAALHRRLAEQRLSRIKPTMTLPRQEEEAEIAAFLAAKGATKLPKRKATAPAIGPIRIVLNSGRSIERRRGNRIKPAPTDAKRPVHDEGGLPHRRQFRRSAPRNQRLL